MDSLLPLVLLLLGFFSLFLLYKVRRRNPLFFFAAFNTFFSWTTARGLDLSSDADAAHAALLLLTSFIIAIYPLIFFNYEKYFLIERDFGRRLKEADLEQGSFSNWTLLVLAALISFLYYRFMVGYNLTALMVAGQDVDFATMRLESYAGERYTAAGPVNQFKNTLMPILFFSISATLIFSRRYFKAAIFILLFLPIFLWAILGTGQRTFLFLSLAGLMLFFHVANVKVKITLMVPAVLAFIAIFSYQSFALGRVDEISIVATFEQLFHRLTSSNQLAALVGFRYVYSLDVVYGYEWFKILRGFVPGIPGSTLSNEVFTQIFGSDRGTAPVSLWASVYHNFGFTLTPAVAICLLKIVERFHDLLGYIRLNTTTIFLYSFLLLYLAVVPLTNPFAIINNGLLGLVLLYIVDGLAVGSSRFSFKFR